MTDHSPSRVLFGPKEIFQILGFAALAGGMWVTLNVSAESGRENTKQLNMHETRITVLEEGIENIEEDVGEIKEEQKEFSKEQRGQRTLLTEILFLVKKQNGIPPR